MKITLDVIGSSPSMTLEPESDAETHYLSGVSKNLKARGAEVVDHYPLFPPYCGKFGGLTLTLKTKE